MQGLPMALANMQVLGRYWLSPPLSDTAVPRAKLIARPVARGSTVEPVPGDTFSVAESFSLLSGVLVPSLDRQLTLDVVMSMSLTATCWPVWRSKHR